MMHPVPNNLSQRIASMRAEAFEVAGEVSKLASGQHVADELLTAAVRMQSVANELGTVETAVETPPREGALPRMHEDLSAVEQELVS